MYLQGAEGYDILPSNVQGRAEQHPSTWLKVTTTQGAGLHCRLSTGRPHRSLCLQAALHAAGIALDAADRDQPGSRAAIRAIGISGQQHGLVALDAAGQVSQ